MPWVKNLLSHYEMNIWVVSKLVAFLQLSAFFIKDVRSWNLFLNSIIISLNFRSYQWNCTKSSSIGRDVWSTGKCPRPALVAACTWLCPQSSPWRRCFCGKNLDFSTFFFFFGSDFSLWNLIVEFLDRFWMDRKCFLKEPRSWVSSSNIPMCKMHSKPSFDEMRGY